MGRHLWRGPVRNHMRWSFRNRPDGIAVPGIIFAGSVIQRSVQAGCKRSCASRKFGAEAFLSCSGFPVMWHFKHGAAGLVNRLRAIAVSVGSSGFTLGGINGVGCEDSAWKNSTTLRISSSDKENVGMRTCRYWRTPLRFVSVLLSDGFARNCLSHSGFTRAPSVVRTGGKFALFSP